MSVLDLMLRFKPHLLVQPLGDGQRVFVMDARRRRMLSGRGLALVAPLLDGQRTVEQLVGLLEQQLSAPEVLFAVQQLQGWGYLEPADTAPPPGDALLWYSASLAPDQVSAALGRLTVELEAIGAQQSAPLAAALEELGVTVVQANAALRVVLVPDLLDPALARINDEALASGQAWAPLVPCGIQPTVGPVFGAQGSGPCWQCLAHRLRANRPVERFLARRLDRPLPALPAPMPAPGRRAALDLGAVALASWCAGDGSGVLDRHLLSLDLLRLQLERHPVVRRPQCPACGDPGAQRARSEAPVRLEPRAVDFAADGGYRTTSPEQTAARCAEQISPITGIISSLGPVPGRDHPLRPVYAASWFACPPVVAPAPDAFHRTSMGKGRSAVQARCSAMCEAIERWSATAQGDEPLVQASLRQLGHAAIHPHRLLEFSAAQYAARPGADQPAQRALQIPRPYADEDQPLAWAPVWSLTHDRRSHAPAEHCYMDLELPPQQRCCPYDSNGDAAGNCLEEAVLQGLLERVERDAVALWWYSRAPRPGVDLASFGEPYFTALQAHYGQLGWRLWVLDVTADLGLPTFVAQARAADGRFTIGCGCHPDARLAVQRALTEGNQLLDPRGDHPLPWDPAAIEDEAYLLPDAAAPPRVFADYPAPPAAPADLRALVLSCVARAERAGLEVLVLDRTRPDAGGICTVKVLVPGLRHFWPRLGPGRLYEVPAQLGWIEQPLTEDQLNPVPLLI